MLTHGSLFTGIGGIDLGFERAGIETIWQVEYDAYATKVLEKHWPNVKRYTDITQIDFTQVEKPDILSGGFPCQDVSYAGKRAGIEGKRSGLWSEFYRAICEIRPRFVVVENVPGLLSSGFGRVLGDLAACGYDAEWDCLPAAAFGAPHLRYRVFIVAYGNDYKSEQQAGNNTRRGTSSKPRDGIGIGASSRNIARDNAEGNKIAGRDTGILYEVLADAEGESRELRQPATERPGRFTSGGETMADAPCERGDGGRETRRRGAEFTDGGCADSLALTQKPGLQGNEPAGDSCAGGCLAECDWWAVEPDVGGRSDGFPLWLERHIGKGMSYAESKRAVEILRELWQGDAAQAIREAIRGLDRLQTAAVLFAFMREYSEDAHETRIFLACPEALEDEVRGVRLRLGFGSSPYRPDNPEQQPGKYSDAMLEVPRFLAFDGETNWQISSWEDGIPRIATGVPNRVDRLKCLGNAVVPQVAEYIGRLIVKHVG